MSTNSSKKPPPMSLEAMLDEERREILSLLEGNQAARNLAPSSPPTAHALSPRGDLRSPTWSMLDVDEPPPAASNSSSFRQRSPPPAAPIRSMLDIDSPVPSPAPPPVRSMLDVTSPVPASPKPPVNKPISPPDAESSTPTSNVFQPRPSVDPGLPPAPRVAALLMDPTSGYQFGNIYSANSGHQSLPKRNTQGGRKSFGVMSDVMRGSDVGGIALPGDRGRHSIPVSARGGEKSKSPQNRFGVRSNSPHSSLLGAASSRQVSSPNIGILDDGRMVDLSSAYRKLSDGNLAFAGGSLSELAARKKTREELEGSGRLTKDYLGPDGEQLEDTSDDNELSSSDDEGERGRTPDPRPVPGSSSMLDNNSLPPRSRDRITQSLMAAAEEERIQVASAQRYTYRSLLDEPEITVTGPGGERARPTKPGIHPNTSYDRSPSSGRVSVNSADDDAQEEEIKRAQKLKFSMTPIVMSPESQRSLRVIYRGEFAKIMESAAEEHKVLRSYMVATDLSDESTHALEWAIGTVLRDGDTLLAICCVDEETGIAGADSNVSGDATKDTLPVQAQPGSKSGSISSASGVPAPFRSSALSVGGDNYSSGSQSPAPSGRERNRMDEDRLRAVQDITNRVTKLLRKTKLQVRVVVEVIHCKNPKHLMTEIIDLINPTLVILGSRGRSALKGVILGSFSNYLVTKSSVPVMVARKRLRKQSQYKKMTAQQVNILSDPTARKLANAKID